MVDWGRSIYLAAIRQERAWIEINPQAIAHNVRQVKRLLSPQTELMAIVKADAYGHGAPLVARAALQAGASWLGVATIPEGVELREAGITAPILILGALNTPEQVQAIVHWRLQPTLCSARQALIFSEVLTDLERTTPLPVHLKLDTGMTRLGTCWQEAVPFAQLVTRLPNLQIASIYSHLATADDPDPTIMKLQHQRFEQAIAQIQRAGIQPPKLHLANSAATLTNSALHYDLVRIGLALYGLYPAEHLRSVIDLQPALAVKARVTQIKTVPAGTGVSYGHRFIASAPMQIAVVGIGYADGVPRQLSNQIHTLIRGQRVPQVGMITMDQLMLDVTALPDLCEGEVVTILGEEGDESLSVEDWATQIGTISWEILCGFKHRLPRITLNPNSAVTHQTPTQAKGDLYF
jgi:alanine racemase